MRTPILSSTFAITFLAVALAACGDAGGLTSGAGAAGSGTGGNGTGGAGDGGAASTGTEVTTGTGTATGTGTGSSSTGDGGGSVATGTGGASSTSSGDGGASTTGSGGAGTTSSGTTGTTGSSTSATGTASSSTGGGCMPSEFTCANGDCIDAGQLCDLFTDCADGSDETSCETICDSGLTTGDALVNACLGASCCSEFNMCSGNGADPDSCIVCFEAGGGALCDAAIACDLQSGCTAGGGNDGICDSGLTSNDPVVDQCLGDNCCVQFNACTSNGADVDSCIACFQAGGGALCDAALACDAQFGCFGSGGNCAPGEFECGSGECIPGDWECDAFPDCVDGSDEANCTQGICDSGVTTNDIATDQCLGGSCCAQFNACTGNGADVDSCIACFQAGGGPLCNPAITCANASGCL